MLVNLKQYSSGDYWTQSLGQNMADTFYLYNFESVFSGTHIGTPRTYSGRLSFHLK